MIVKSRYKMLPYAGYVDPESTLAIWVHHDGHLEATERTFCSLYHTPFAVTPDWGPVGNVNNKNYSLLLHFTKSYE